MKLTKISNSTIGTMYTSTTKLFNYFSNQSTNQSSKQPANQPTNQANNQPTNQQRTNKQTNCNHITKPLTN